jgi:hypothetical protein
MIRSLRDDVTALATPAGRMVGTPGHAEARRYLVGRMAELDLRPYADASFELPYEVGGQQFTNLAALLPGARSGDQRAGLEPIMLLAHYDTAGPFPGADDNAAAVAILLSLVPRLREKGLERPIVLAFPDAEEPPYFLSPAMGSTFFYTRQRTGPVHAAIVLDLVGHDVPVPGLSDLLFITGLESDPVLAGLLRACEPHGGVRIVAALNRYVGDMSDHHVFRVNERPYLFLSCGHWAHYHQPSDTPEKLNYSKMAYIADYLLGLVTEVCDAELKGPFEGYDSTETELYFMRRSLGEHAAALGLRFESRRDIDALATLLTRTFGL